MLYKTEVEYGDYTMNHVLGCSHGCIYPCYAFMMARRFGRVRNYQEWCEPKLVRNTLELLDYEIPRLSKKMKSVHLCFTSDPFMSHYSEVGEMSLLAIRKLNKAKVKCTVLTKGMLPIELANESVENEYGITLISLDRDFNRQFEPFAPSAIDRIASLKALHERGFRTWVSIEPYPTPNIIEQDLLEILSAVSFVDRIVFGRTNYNKRITEFKDYRAFYKSEAQKLEDFCRNLGIESYVKKATVSC
jgi:DNA repair photolyase